MKLRSLKNDNHGFIGFFLVFVLLVTCLLFLFAMAIPFLTSFSAETYSMGERIMEDSIDDLQNIHNETIRNRLIQTMTDSQNATEENIDMLAFFFQYSWIFIIVIVSVVMWVLARRTSELYQVV